MKRSVSLLFQSGVHTPHGTRYNAARIKNWPLQNIPSNFAFTTEQKMRAKFIPRDTGKIPRDFVLSVLYRHQPCEVSALWNYCSSDPRVVLDSKKHLRDVLQQMRSEGFINFEKNLNSQVWECYLTREKYEYVRNLVRSNSSLHATADAENSIAGTLTNEMSQTDNITLTPKSEEEHPTTPIVDLQGKMLQLEHELAETTKQLSKYQHVEADYLPYTDLNGKVNFMWWYETTDCATESSPDHDGISRLSS